MRPTERSTGRRSIGVALLVAALALLVAACGGSSNKAASTTTGTGGGQGPLVAFLLPENVTPRWEGFDKPTFTKALRQAMPGVRVDVLNAVNNPATQTSQAEQELTKGAKVLVVAPIDGKGFGTIARKADNQGVKVIAYDRLISGAPLAAYVSFDGVAVGRAQGTWLADHTKSGDRIAVINGATTDDNAHLFNQGYMGVLNPLFDAGTRKLVGPKDGTWTPGWDPPTAQREMEQLLTRSHNGIDAVLSANDGMAGGIIAALKAQGLAGKVPVTGQDASLEGVQNILRGDQGMSVFKDFRLQAPAAAKATAALLKGTVVPGVTGTVDNGAGKVPAIILPVQAIDESNLQTLVDDGYVADFLGGLDKVCSGMPKTGICA